MLILKNQQFKNWQIKEKISRFNLHTHLKNSIIDTFRAKKFGVQDLETGEHTKNFDARVFVTNSQGLFKFENITVADRDLMIKLFF
ncbi:MAG TPA: hypothetical protein VFV86_04505, partial [Nitrososphaeraceae archaeon]|nr:hypothetical protein [Nitrososphaeraceae archaeon]